MSPLLETMLDQLGIKPKPRFTVEEVAEILGIRRDQVLDLLKRKKLIGMRASVSKWSGVFAQDLAEYIQIVNAPRETKGESKERPLNDQHLVCEAPSDPKLHQDKEEDSTLDSPSTPEPESKEQTSAREFVRKISFLPIARTLGRRIHLQDLTGFYFNLTKLEDPFDTPVLWKAIAHAEKQGTTHIREVLSPETFDIFYEGIDLCLLKELFPD